MKKMLYVILLFVAGIIIQACNPCKNVLPPPSYFELIFVDSSNQNLLGTTYNQSSFKLYNGNSTNWLNYDPALQGELLRIGFESIMSNTIYYLDLSSNDTDTIQVDFTSTAEKCYNTYSIVSFNYNGKSLNTNQSIQYTIVK